MKVSSFVIHRILGGKYLSVIWRFRCIEVSVNGGSTVCRSIGPQSTP